MSKLSYEDKVNLYNDKIKGIAIKSLGPKYGITYHNAQYLIRLIDNLLIIKKDMVIVELH